MTTGGNRGNSKFDRGWFQIRQGSKRYGKRKGKKKKGQEETRPLTKAGGKIWKLNYLHHPRGGKKKVFNRRGKEGKGPILDGGVEKRSHRSDRGQRDSPFKGCSKGGRGWCNSWGGGERRGNDNSPVFLGVGGGDDELSSNQSLGLSEP